jgi:hypothetical protein
MTTGLVSTLAEFFSQRDDSQYIQIIKVIQDLFKPLFEYSLAYVIRDLFLHQGSLVRDADDLSRSFRTALQLPDEASELGDS